tara:strand:- start:6794 stop:7645 length:852 start_codon:yes stop_codon:yes gene_type:complete
MSAFNMSMFESIKGALASSNEGKSKFSEIMQTKPGNTYTVRLLPDGKSPVDTFFHYYNMGWNSFATGQYVQALSPQTFGERCPINEERFRLSRTGTDEEKEKASALRRTEKWLVNVYVVDDPTNPENNGKVKMLRYGKQIQKIITEAIEGEDASEFGARIFDLSDEGVSFKVKCEQQGDYPTYVSSRFTSAGKLNFTEEKQNEIYAQTHTLKETFPIKSTDELTVMLNEHFHCKADEPEVTPASPGDTPPWSQPGQSAPALEPAATPVDSSVEDDIDELLADL